MTSVVAPTGLRLVALDIDDTLIPWRGTLARETVDAVRAVRAAGIQVVLASGRGITDVAHLSHELEIDEFWALCSNGSVTARVTRGEFEVVTRVTFDPRGIVDALRAQDPDAPVAIESSGIGFLVDGDPFEGQAPHVAGSLVELPDAVTFLSIASAVLTQEQLLETTLAAPVRAVPYPHDGWVTVDVVSADVGKGAALAALAAAHGIVAAECAAVGDYLNDIPMLEWAGWAVAMGQAPREVKRAADAVVTPAAQHGAAQALLAIAAAG